MTKKHIIITPVSNPDSQSNFKYEMDEARYFRPLLWDGEVNGNDEAGDTFAWKIGEDLFVTKVKAVLGSKTRRSHWSNSSSLQANGKPKNVLLLDPFVTKIEYKQWLQDARKSNGKSYKDNLMFNGTKRLDWPY